ncbi:MULTISPECIES: LysR family transcriptional regulator [Halomonadaceae]|uniref:LysR family transcriptional regulator n=1 Tax=Halomonadaceae TaxID=28256 RepID=UPI00159A8BBF|nr:MULTISPECIES: LysR family transcriptional regulator [Halomonas]QJQ96830.1 LysR family transcriptional regulator [Halomonas sp. PA5]
MEIKWFEDFLSLARCKSFSRAASERHVTQSALSRRIRQLEDWLGFPLVDRTTTPIRLSPQGSEFLPYAKELIHSLDCARDDIKSRYTEDGGVLTFAALNTLSLTFFPNWVRSMGQRHAGVQMRLVEPCPSFLGTISPLIEGQSDFLLTYAHDSVASMSELERFAFVGLGSERVLPVSLAGRDGAPLHPVEQGGSPIRYLSYGAGTFFGQALKRVFERSPLALSKVYENTMSAGLKAMVMAGSGVAWLPHSLIHEELSRGILVAATDNEAWQLQVEIRLYRARQVRSRCAEQFWQDVVYERVPVSHALTA